MAEEMAQNYATHKRFVPAFHVVAFGILVINLIWATVTVIRDFSLSAVVSLLLAVALLILFLYMRVFALTVQDRVIRLEMRLLMARLLPEDSRARIDEFTPGQLIALRFASDEELPGLAAQVLEQKIRDRETIKKMIKTWKPDLLRV